MKVRLDLFFNVALLDRCGRSGMPSVQYRRQSPSTTYVGRIVGVHVLVYILFSYESVDVWNLVGLDGKLDDALDGHTVIAIAVKLYHNTPQV